MQELKEILEAAVSDEGAMIHFLEVGYFKGEIPRETWEIRKLLIRLALAKLKEEPEPSEFTKNIMANLERWDSDLSDARIKSIIAWLKEVCRRYDWLVKRNAKLHAEIKQLVDGQVARKEAGS